MIDKGIYSVSEINSYLKNLLDSSSELFDLCIAGEISNYKCYPSGHHYFSLKDSESTLPCVMFKGNAVSLRFRPENGMSVLAKGRISIYERDGKYQLYCNTLYPVGIGNLQLEFERLKAKLSKEGIFDQSHKKPLPRFPKTIVVVTSPSGAVVHDITRILNERWPLSAVKILPVRVQGVEAPQEMIDAIKFANDAFLGDVIILGRGGGSLEDLWAFNDEGLAREIYESTIPVISAVGHEPDVTISDYVADARASTPSNAAEIVVPDSSDFIMLLDKYSKVLNPKSVIDRKRMDLDLYLEKLRRNYMNTVGDRKRMLATTAAKLDALSPMKVLSRGYAIAITDAGRTVRTSEDISVDDRLSLQFLKGRAIVTVEEIENE